MSLTTTFAPARAKAKAWERPSPRPAPVTMTDRPSHIPATSIPLSWAAAFEPALDVGGHGTRPTAHRELSRIGRTAQGTLCRIFLREASRRRTEQGFFVRSLQPHRVSR